MGWSKKWTLLVVLATLTVIALGTASAQEYPWINGTNVSVKALSYTFNESVIGTPLYFQVYIWNTSALTGNFTITYQNGLSSNVTNGSTINNSTVFWVNATTPGTYWINISNQNNASEYVNFTVVFNDADNILITTYPPYYADATWYNVTVHIGKYLLNHSSNSMDFIEAGVPFTVTIRDTGGSGNGVYVSNGAVGSDVAVTKQITGHGNFSVMAFGPNAITATFLFNYTNISGVNVTNTTTITFLQSPNVGWITGQFRDVNNNEVFATPSEPILVNVTPLTSPTVTMTFLRADNKSFYTIEVPAGNYSVTAIKINATTGQKLAIGSVVVPVVVQPNRTATADIVFRWVITPTRIEITENKEWALADGTDSIVLTIKAYGWRADIGEVPLAGAQINVTTTLGALNGTSTSIIVTTDQNGKATVTLTSTQTGTATVTAYIQNYNGRPYPNINASVQKIFILYGQGAVSGEVRLATNNTGTEGAKVWIIPESLVLQNAITITVPTDTTYVRVLKIEDNRTAVVPYDYYTINPGVLNWWRISTDVDWCKPAVMGSAGEGYNVTMSGNNLAIVFFEPGRYEVQWTNVSKNPMNLTNSDFITAATINVTGNLTYEYALMIENTIKAYTGVDVKYATTTGEDGGYTLYGIYGNGSTGVPYVIFVEKDGYRRAFKEVLIEDAEPHLIWVCPGDDTDFVLIPRVVPYTYKLEITAVPSIIPTGATSNVTATVYRKPALSIEAPWEPVRDVTVTLEIVRNNVAANDSSWLNDGYTTTVMSGGSATFKAGNAIGVVTIRGSATITDEFGRHNVTNTTTITITEFAEISGYVTNETGIHLEGWAKIGRIAVAIWTFNETAYRQGVSGPDPKYCELLPAASINSQALDIVARYYGVNPADIRVNTTYGSQIIPANPRLAASDAGYTFARLLAPPPDSNETYRFWVAAYVDTGSGMYYGYSLVSISTTGTHTANIVIREIRVVTPPDLVIRGVAIPQVVPNETATINVTIANIGGSDAGTFNVSLYVNGTLLGNVTVDALSAGASKVISFNWTPVQEGTYKLRIVADSDNRIVELNEANNVYTTTVQVSTQVPIWKNYDTNNNNKIDDNEVIRAIEDWLNNKISDQDLLSIIMKWLE